MIPVNPEAIGDPDQTPVVYVGSAAAEVLGIPNRSASDSSSQPIDTEAVRRLTDAATPGPWWAWDRGVGWQIALGEPTAVDEYGRPLWYLPEGTGEGTLTESDARFIAAARTAVPALLAALEEARRERDTLREVAKSNKRHVQMLTQHYEAIADQRDAATARAERAETEVRAGVKLYVAALDRAERAEAAIERVRRLLGPSPDVAAVWKVRAVDILAALDGTGNTGGTDALEL